MRDRAFRRFQESKKKKWVKKNFQHYRLNELSDRDIGMFAHSPKICSCWMCGNARETEGDTLQEIKNKNILKQELSDEYRL